MADSSNSQSNDETELTMCDVLKEEEELEQESNAVLGGSDDTNCSYDKGYVPRQALYACLTCSKDQEPSGVCLACSYKCHDKHDVVELYTKRNFRCDCGNSKFPNNQCSLKTDKDPINYRNVYNQNFRGVYCSCSRPYPDLEDDIPDQMIQCVMCEDWHHGRHIGQAVPEDFYEMICAKCMESHKFLYTYLNKFQYVNVTENEQESNTNIKEMCNGSSGIDDNNETKTLPIKVEESVKEENNVDETSASAPTKQADANENTTTIKSEINDTTKSDCLLSKLAIKPDGIMEGPAFWAENWRKELCRCPACMNMYHKLGCQFLLNVEDTVQAYEEQGKSTGGRSQYECGMNALSQLDRVRQMEAIRGYTRMKGQLMDYLREFSNNKRTVCESDIKEFFEQMAKRRRSGNSIPHFCR